jgi:hypothetical protein
VARKIFRNTEADLVPETAPSALQTNSMIAAKKHRIFEMMFSASGSGSEGKANPNAAQTANTGLRKPVKRAGAR